MSEARLPYCCLSWKVIFIQSHILFCWKVAKRNFTIPLFAKFHFYVPSSRHMSEDRFTLFSVSFLIRDIHKNPLVCSTGLKQNAISKTLSLQSFISMFAYLGSTKVSEFSALI